MKITLNKARFDVDPDFFLRRAGYGQIKSYHTGQTSYVRRFSRDHYPRFHMYFETGPDRVVFNLHLDQKQVSYEGADHAHNADHDGPVVEAEIERLKGLIRQFAASGQTGREGVNPNGEDWERQLAKELAEDKKVGPGSAALPEDGQAEKKGFLRKLLGF